jgi:septum formation protein
MPASPPSRAAPPNPLVLASTSRYRKELLARLGVPFLAAAPGCDEEAFKSRGLSPRGLAEALATAKAESLRGRFPGAAILGSDQVATVDGDVLGKPGSHEAAAAQLARLSGRTHLLITAVSLAHDGGVLRHTDVARLTMRPLARAAIERYVAADDPVDCAGAYKLEGRGIALFSSVEAADATAIVGLPLIAVTAMLAALGFEIP